MEAARLLQLEALIGRKPRHLSGGQQQRVALGRALVREPQVFLLDEPLSNLDAKLRAHMRAELIELHRRIGKTMVYVTHDQLEAMTMSDRIAVMQGGSIEQIGAAREIYEAPASAFVATFIGTTNLVRGTVASATGGTLLLTTTAGPARIAGPGHYPAGAAAHIVIRPERMKLAKPPEVPACATAWPAQVIRLIYLGGRTEIHLRLQDGSTAVSYVVNEGSIRWREGDTVAAWFRPEDAWLLPS